jgi:hypothetical protein
VQKKKKKLEIYKKFHHGSPQVPPHDTSKRKTNQPVPIFVFATLCYTPPNEELENDAQPIRMRLFGCEKILICLDELKYIYSLCSENTNAYFFYLSARPLEEANPRSLPDPLDSKIRKSKM